MKVRDLREALADIPDDYETVIEVVVGGDIGTDYADVCTVDLRGSVTGTHVVLAPADDAYDVESLINEALEARAARAAEVLKLPVPLVRDLMEMYRADVASLQRSGVTP